MLTIKSAGVPDIALIRDLAMQVWPQTYAPIIGKQQVAYMLALFYSPQELEKQMASGHQFIICFSNDVPAAFASWSEIKQHIFKLHKLYILPQYQGMGIGAHIISYITDALKDQQAAELRLNVNRFNLSAISFYNKTGFLPIHDEDIDIGNGYFMNDHVFAMQLP